ncbi:hypothetical protein PsorP6_011801 [Peronosclerospora sorghi]|uniref:Uncharacterized protein n=1 Tax=Peronosclerospora sorghi TaxID=230839 RepID=A0ACC0WJJ6_9STRA|nr:hypothetical protein PsorP6_011801 [Peronosclerospora sorghi]
MSDVVVPSFFPTPTEIAGGIRWVRQHPVVATAAAAAATAVTVLSYLKAAAEGEVDLNEANLRTCSKQKEIDDLGSSTESDASSPSGDRTFSPCNISLTFVVSRIQFVVSDAEGDVETDVAVESSELDQALQEADGDIVSPQWGWYVSITPPEEYY